MDVESTQNTLSIASVVGVGSSAHQLSSGKGPEQSVADFDAEQEGIELGNIPRVPNTPQHENHVVNSGLAQQLAAAKQELATMTAERDSALCAIAERNTRPEQDLHELTND